jgi:CRP-like cAMP-binding protein
VTEALVSSLRETAHRNRLLGALPGAELERLLPQLTYVCEPPKKVLQEALEPVRAVYFPVGGVFSITTSLAEGITVEAATVGDEGVAGAEALLGDNALSAGELMVQVPDGCALRMDAKAFRQQLAVNPTLQALVGQYLQVLIAQMAQGAACNARHPVQERCAKWLLLTHDRMHADELRLSHEVLAMMLATTRPTVTVVARTLQQAGLIAYTYGKVRILDRAGLEQAACSCYTGIREQFASLHR